METQTYRRNLHTPFEIANKYFRVMCALNNIRLGEKELLVLSFVATHSQIGEARKLLRYEYGISSASLSNILKRLKKKGLLTDTFSINPYARADWNNGVKLEIWISNIQNQ